MKNKLAVFNITVLLLLPVVLTYCSMGEEVTSTSGTMDPFLATGGIVVRDNGVGVSGDDYGNSITTDSTGRIVVAGQSWNGVDTDMLVWRYNIYGALDTSFDSDGIVGHNNAAGGNGNDSGKAIAIDAGGRILVAGYSTNAAGNTDMVIWCYSMNGLLDTSFGSGGIVVHDSAAGGSTDDSGTSITIDADGKIIVAGFSTNISGDADMVVWRYNTDGTLDATFDSDGVVVHDNAAGGSGDDFGYSITTDANGRIVITGKSRNGSGNYDMALWRYNADGTLDTTFDSNGILVHDNAAGGSGDDSGSSITVLIGCGIVVTGESRNSSGNSDMVIWKYNADATLDTTFGVDGIVVHDSAAGGGGDDSGNAITYNYGGIVVAGKSLNASGNYDMAIWHYNWAGDPNILFTSDGIVTHDNGAGGSYHDAGTSISFASNGRILVTGYSTNHSGNTDMAIWRYNP